MNTAGRSPGKGGDEQLTRLIRLLDLQASQPAIRRLRQWSVDAVATRGSCRRPGQFTAGTADRLPFEDGSVDVLRCERVLQHLDEPEDARRDARVLRPGGRAVVLDSTGALW
jgi:SAM-dependent methyltransferase